MDAPAVPPPGLRPVTQGHEPSDLLYLRTYLKAALVRELRLGLRHEEYLDVVAFDP